LKPRSRWFDVTKWQALAAREVARELKVSHVWSWGWAQRDARSNDPDKSYAACVWLWSRDARLCDAPEILGKELDADVRTGQLNLPAGTRCVYGTTRLTASSVASLAKVTRDREIALTALVVRGIERERAPVSPSAALAVEQRIVRLRFGGSTSAYRAALTEAGASMSVGRAILGDGLRSRAVASRLASPSVSAADVARFRATYASVLAREVVVSPAPSWLPDGRGLALATSAPERLFRLPTGRRSTLRTVEGVFTVEARGDATALATVSYAPARLAIVRELNAERGAEAYAAWSIRMQKAAESKLVCERDRLPELGVVDVSSYAPFLSLSEPEADRWLAAQRAGG